MPLSLRGAHRHNLTQSTTRYARVGDTIEGQFAIADIVVGGVEVRHTATDRAAMLWDEWREACDVIAPSTASILQESADAHITTRQTSICFTFETSYLFPVVVPAVGINPIDDVDKRVGCSGVGGEVTVGAALAIDAQCRRSGDTGQKEDGRGEEHVDGGIIFLDLRGYW